MEATELELETLDVPGSRSYFHTSCLVISVASRAAVGGREERGGKDSQSDIGLRQTELHGAKFLTSRSSPPPTNPPPKNSAAPVGGGALEHL